MRLPIGWILVATLPAALIMCVAAPAPIRAQVTTATVYGTVIDSSGARIPGVTVNLTQQETGAVTTKITTETGDFQFDFVRAGTYTISMELTGFKTYKESGIQLGAGQGVRRTYTLEVGQSSETVSVEASFQLLNTVSPEQQQTFDMNTVTDLPLARRNFSGILSIGTGVNTASGGSSEGVRMNGVGRAGTGFAVDGTDSNGNLESRGAQNFGGANYVDTLSLEAVSEVNVVKGVLQAEYGGVLGGQVNVLTRSGTNQFHGSLFENFQGAALNARDPFLTTKPGFTYNQFGGSLGGPIRTNRIFFFGAYEGYRESRGRRLESTVPTKFLRDQLVAANPSYALSLQFLPLPNQPHNATGNTGLFVGAAKDYREDNHIDLKNDFKISSNSNLALTFTRGRPFQDATSITTAVDPTWTSPLQARNSRGTVSFVIGGASWTSESRYGTNWSNTDRLTCCFHLIDPVNPKEQFAYGRRLGRISTNLGFNTPASEIVILKGPTQVLSEKFSKQLGQHSFKFGGQYSTHCCQRANVEAVGWTYTGLPDLLANIPSNINVSFGQGEYSARLSEWGLFMQDDWRIHPRLTLNLGLRYDFFGHMIATPKDAARSFLVNPDGLNISNMTVGPIRPERKAYESDAVNFGPRFGFAYNVAGNSKTVVRGGMGVLFSPQIMAALWSGVHSLDAPRRVIFSRQDAIKYGLKYPMYNDDFRAVVARLIKDEGITQVFQVINPEIQNPYAFHYTLGVQHELASDLALETSFVGVSGRKFLMNRVPNEPDRITGNRPNPKLITNFYLDESQTSTYLSWQTSLRKRYSRNLSSSVHYTWGKALAYGGGGDIGAAYQGDNNTRVQDFYNIKTEKGPGAGDVTHNFVGEWVYDTPVLSSRSSIVRQVLGTWQIGGVFSAATGEPLGITQATSLYHQRPDYVAGQDPINENWKDTPNRQYLNLQAFAQVPTVQVSGAAARPGSLGWGAVRGPGFWNINLSVGKNFPIREKVKLQLRADMFNALNKLNLSTITTSINSGTFGQARGTRGQRVIQLNGRLSF
jgi:Carboxypeptidase regulatory-like domain